MVSDARIGRTVVIGATGRLWAWTGTTWQPLASGRGPHGGGAAVYDPALGDLVVFGTRGPAPIAGTCQSLRATAPPMKLATTRPAPGDTRQGLVIFDHPPILCVDVAGWHSETPPHDHRVCAAGVRAPFGHLGVMV